MRGGRSDEEPEEREPGGPTARRALPTPQSLNASWRMALNGIDWSIVRGSGSLVAGGSLYWPEDETCSARAGAAGSGASARNTALESASRPSSGVEQHLHSRRLGALCVRLRDAVDRPTTRPLAPQAPWWLDSVISAAELEKVSEMYAIG